MYFSHNDINSLFNIANEDLKNVENWLKLNRLTLNLNKSHYILFSRRKRTLQNIPLIKINDNPLSRVENTLFLGINITSNLSWKLHIKELTSKINKYNSILYLSRDCLTRSSLKLLYTSLIYPLFLYGNIIWGHCPKSIINPLEIAQKKIIRTIMYRSRYHHTHRDFTTLDILKLEDLIFFSSCCFVYKSINNLTFPSNYFTINNTITRQNGSLYLPLYRSKQRQTSPSYYSVADWNSLPIDLRTKPSFASLKRSLKIKLLNDHANVVPL